MFNLIKDNGEVKEKFPKGEYCFKFYKDSKLIGVAAINNDEDDKIYIYIKNEERGNGYGKILFSEILSELIKMDYSEVKVEIKNGNIPMIRIIDLNGGLQLSTNKDKMQYLIPLEK